MSVFFEGTKLKDLEFQAKNYNAETFDWKVECLTNFNFNLMLSILLDKQTIE